MVLDGALAIVNVGAEPGSEPGRVAGNTRNVRVSVGSIALGNGGGVVDFGMLLVRATVKISPLVVDTGDGQFTREIDLCNIPNSGIDVLGGTVSIDVGEEVQWLNGVVSSARSSEVVAVETIGDYSMR